MAYFCVLCIVMIQVGSLVAPPPHLLALYNYFLQKYHFFSHMVIYVFLQQHSTFVMRSSKMSLNSEKNKSKFSFHVQCMSQPQRYTTLKPPSKLSIRFKRYSNFDAQNNKIQRELNAIIGCISKSMISCTDSFCLITSNFCIKYLK